MIFIAAQFAPGALDQAPIEISPCARFTGVRDLEHFVEQRHRRRGSAISMKSCSSTFRGCWITAKMTDHQQVSRYWPVESQALRPAFRARHRRLSNDSVAAPIDDQSRVSNCSTTPACCPWTVRGRVKRSLLMATYENGRAKLLQTPDTMNLTTGAVNPDSMNLKLRKGLRYENRARDYLQARGLLLLHSNLPLSLRRNRPDHGSRRLRLLYRSSLSEIAGLRRRIGFDHARQAAQNRQGRSVLPYR